MNRSYAFHKTVRGYNHGNRNLPTEDYSDSFSSEDGTYYMIAVADGHGSKSCFRSNRGSKFAVECAISALKKFADMYLESDNMKKQLAHNLISNPRQRDQIIRQLTDSVIAEWYDKVLDDFSNDPPTHQAYVDAGIVRENEMRISVIAHIYGSTIMAALKISDIYLLLQQGDGRCVIFYDDGRIEQPIPWDERCVGSITTSLCDEDASVSMRSIVIDTNKNPIMACYLGSDGVEDAYRDTYEALGESHGLMGGVHNFYRYLSCELTEKGEHCFVSFLDHFLEEFSRDGKFSRSGSGDDISVAGIVDVERIRSFVHNYRKDNEIYKLEEDLFWCEEQIRSMSRKHGILLKRRNDEQSKKEELEKELRGIQAECQRLEGKKSECDQNIYSLSFTYKMQRGEIIDLNSRLDGYAGGRYEIQGLYKDIRFKMWNVAKNMRNQGKNKNEYDASLVNERQNEELSCAEKRFKDADDEYREYDVKFKRLETEKSEIEEKIRRLKNEGKPTIKFTQIG